MVKAFQRDPGHRPARAVRHADRGLPARRPAGRRRHRDARPLPVSRPSTDRQPRPVRDRGCLPTIGRSGTRTGATIPAMLDHEEKFLFKEEILHLANAVAEPGILDNVEDLLTDVITSPRFDSEVFTLERSLQVMLGAARRDDAGRPADRRAGGLRRGRRGPHPVRGPRAARRLAGPLRPGHRQRPELPQQPRRHPGPQLRDPGRPRRGAARPPGPADARPLQQRAAVLRGRRERLPRPRRRHHGAARPVPRAGRGRRRDAVAGCATRSP